jgi:hypothetical protein
MHASSYNEMKGFVERYLDRERPLSVLDVGSLDVNGSYKDLFSSPHWSYTGIDLVPGPNVDVISDDPYRYPFPDGAFDVVISGSVLEHVDDMRAIVSEMVRVMKPGGIMCIIAPWTYPEHKYPTDCWRILPDGMSYLLGKVAGLPLLGAYKNETDCVGIAGRIQKDIKVAFGAMVNDKMRLDMCLAKSDLPGELQVILDPDSATVGLNKLLAIMESASVDVAILAHQDMHFQQGWLQQVKRQIALLPDSWVVAGIVGKDMEGNICGKFHDMRIAPIFDTSDIHTFPQPASCFDECCILVNLKKGFRFDEALDGFDLYGTLAVLQAWEAGGTAWVIDAFAEHYCLRPFTWFPDKDFQARFKWLYGRFPNAPKIDSTVLGVPKNKEMAA